VKRWFLVFLLLLLLPGLVAAQMTHRETVIWDFANGLKIFGVPYGASGASTAGQLFLSTGPGSGVWATLPTSCPLVIDPVTHAFVCGTGGVGGGTLGAAGTLQASDGAGGQAAFGGSACPVSGTFATGQSATGLLTCAAPMVPPLTAKPILAQASSEFPTGVNLGALMPGVLTITTAAGVATVSTVTMPSGNLVGTDAVQELLNKTVVDRVNPASDPATTGGVFTPNPSLYDVESFSTIAAPFTVANFSGPVRAHKWYRLRMRSALPQAITWGTAFNANARTPLPTSTSGSNYDDLFLFEYDPTSGQLEIIFNSKVVAAASGGVGGTATAAGAAGDVQFHDTGTGLQADTGRYTYDPGTHLTSAQGALAGEGPGVMSLTDPHGYTLTLVAPFLSKDRVIAFGDTDGVPCTTATCGGGGTVLGTMGDVISIGASNVPSDSGVVAANLVTAPSNFVSGNLVQGAGANKTSSDSGIATSAVVTLTGTQTVSGKRRVRRVTSLSTSSTFTCTGDASDICKMQMTGSSGTFTIAAPSGTPNDGDQLEFWFLCTNSQTFSWNAIFIDSPNVVKQTTCPADTAKWTKTGIEYSSDLTKWQVIATN